MDQSSEKDSPQDNPYYGYDKYGHKIFSRPEERQALLDLIKNHRYKTITDERDNNSERGTTCAD